MDGGLLEQRDGVRDTRGVVVIESGYQGIQSVKYIVRGGTAGGGVLIVENLLGSQGGLARNAGRVFDRAGRRGGLLRYHGIGLRGIPSVLRALTLVSAENVRALHVCLAG